jgi:hypothetical protein
MVSSSIPSTYDPEIEMNRGPRLTPTVRIKRRIAALLGLRAGGDVIGNPCRSVDRKMQEYSPPSDR